MATKIAINGFGRIGRAFFKVASKRPELEIVAINDLGDADNVAYLLKYDTVYGRSGYDITTEIGEESFLVVNGKKIKYLSVKEPADMPWKALGIDVVVESTGLFASYEKSRAHLDAGAKKVVITAPVKDTPPDGIRGETVLMGINDSALVNVSISSNASCTTNAAGPVMAILDEVIGIEKALLSTVHGYTASQSIVDGRSKKDWKEGRAAAQNIVPTSTGAATAVAQALPQLLNKFDGISMRVPVPAGSIADITFLAKRNTSVEEVNEILRGAAAAPRWAKIFSVTEDPIVSSDIIGNPFASIADLNLTRVVDGNLVKVCAWYDNEMGYTHALVEHVIEASKYLNS
ncbi:MAG: type I glyceraldehyde-3-phosphate dehydrogenase [bacterium]|nr:type I glyceraldehyde-3-phosphate dehydrogenase [bacterium]